MFFSMLSGNKFRQKNLKNLVDSKINARIFITRALKKMNFTLSA